SKDLAEAIGLSETNLSLLKQGRVKGVRFATLEAICRELECTPGDLLEYRPESGWARGVAARAPLLQDGPQAFEGRRHRLPAHRVAVALEVERARGRVAAAPLPADPDRANRLVLGAAARPGDAGHRDRDARARMHQRRSEERRGGT